MKADHREQADHAGYLVNRLSGPEGVPGLGYDYLIAQNGLHVQSQNPFITARTQLSTTHVRGLAPAPHLLHLSHGRIPKRVFETGLRWFQDTPDTERFFGVTWDGDEYRIVAPQQTGHATRLHYQPPSGLVAEFHSHARSAAFFSSTDDADEQAFRIYGVVGKLHTPWPELRLRIGIYGYFGQLDWTDVFEGPAPGVLVKTHADPSFQDD